MFTERAKTIALAIVHIFETAKPLGDYGAVAVLTDGAGFSVGINQFTHKSGSLYLVLARFMQLGGELTDSIKNALPDFKTGSNIAHRQGDVRLKADLKALGPDPLWHQAQREIAFEKYLKPALDACDGSGFLQPLSLAVVYDSINQGGYATVRNKVSASDKNEKAWITEYCADRKQWLKNSKKAVVRSTVYRPNFFLGEIAQGNWDLALPLTVNGHKLTESTLFPSASAATPSANPASSTAHPSGPTTVEPTDGQPPIDSGATAIETPTSAMPEPAAPPKTTQQTSDVQVAEDGTTAVSASSKVGGFKWLIGSIIAIVTGQATVPEFVNNGLQSPSVWTVILNIFANLWAFKVYIIGAILVIFIVRKLETTVLKVAAMRINADGSKGNVVLTQPAASTWFGSLRAKVGL